MARVCSDGLQNAAVSESVAIILRQVVDLSGHVLIWRSKAQASR